MKKATETRSEFDRYELYLLNMYLNELKGGKAVSISTCTQYSADKKRSLKLDIEQIDSLQVIINNKMSEMLKEVI